MPRRRSVFNQPNTPGLGTRLVQLLFILILLALVGGVLFFGFWDYRPPPQPVEEVIPNDRFRD